MLIVWIIAQVQSVETPISRMFGGRGRSTIRRPAVSDSVTIESWRHLGLSIQGENVLTVEDALRELSRPEIVQLSSSSKGVMVDGSKQYLVDALPPVLVLHIKRFQYDSVVKDVVKIKKPIRFEHELVIPKGMRYLLLSSSYNSSQS
jgi:ubiquitin carboxyl-terminal hydrolase 10